MKKIISFVLSVVIFTSIIPNCAFASEQEVLAQYSGSTTASYGYKPNCTFTVNKIIDDKFRGSFSATNLGRYNINQSINGKVYNNYDSFTCVFSLENYYNTSFVITVYPLEGYCECISSGTWHFVDFRMNGTKFTFDTNSEISGNAGFDESDLVMCMLLSSTAYKKKYKNNQLVSLKECIVAKGFDLNTEDLRSYNYLNENNNKDSNKNDVAFSITYRKIDDNNVDLIVVIRGSYNDEWSGNAELTGETYDSDQKQHTNFSIAKDSIEKPIEQYLSQYLSQYQNINLIITGHSRGAAVSNLYAKEAIDKINGINNSNDIPKFNKVTAYTFACPNVEKYNNTMENYSSIFNFCLSEDLVPTVPLTYPSDGWNYWKYGITYITDLDYKYFWNYTGLDNRNTRLSIYAIHAVFSNWSNVEEYYNKQIGKDGDYTTLFKFFIQTANEWKSVDSKPELLIRINRLMKRTKKYPEIGELVKCIANGAKSVIVHLPYFYEPTIKNYNHIDRNGVSLYRRYTYQNCLYDFKNKRHFAENIENQNNSISEHNSPTTIVLSNLNLSNISQLTSFANQGDNLSILGWDLDDPSTWTGITWNEDGNVEGIDLSFKNLSGSLDLSNFSSLKKLDVTGNNLTSLKLGNCSSLEELDCSFNKLTTLDLSDCTNLTSVTCCYNYLDTHEGSTLYNKLDDLMFSDCYVNYYPQSVPDNATFDTTELNALKTFANTNNNNTALNWLDDGGNIDTEKLQNNVLFEYDGSKHRVVAIDISDLDVSGALDLTSLTLLQELYCENTKVTTLNIKGCTKLETLKCDGCELTSITLPSNANAKTSSLYDVSCEYNYLDTSIFTQDIIKYVEFKAGGEIQYKNQKGDSSALQAALYFANKLDEKDYSEETFKPFKELIDECYAYNYDNLYLTQEDIDEIATNILVSMYDLKAYFKVNISSSNGSFTVNDEKSSNSYKQSLLYGTTVTLNAVPNEGYIFIGWYDTVNSIYMSKNPEYTFKVSTNTDLKAVFIAEGSATLTFVNYSNWVAGTFTKSTAEWTEVTSINDLLPEVPFRFGYSNGRWVYDEQEVLSKLQAGEDVVIGAEYDEDDASFPTPPVAKDKPVLELYYKYNEENALGTFMMAAGFPENIKVESVGIAFYYKKADLFDPRDNFTLLLNNKMMIGRFNTEQLEDIYIINMHKMTSTYNWAARGFVTYYDSNGNLVTEYLNQINIIDRQNTDEIK